MKTTRLFLFLAALATACAAPSAPEAPEKHPYQRIDNPDSKQLLLGVKVPAGNDLFFSSGLVATQEALAQTGTDSTSATYLQSVSTLRRIEKVLQAEGLELADVIKMNVYLAPDASLDGSIGFADWFKAYGEFFANARNPNKVARTTVGVAALARPNIFVEVEVVAVYE